MAAKFDDVVQLPVLHSVTVPAEWADVNGHMNMRHYLALHAEGGDALFQGIGFDQRYIDSQRRFFFDLEHHLTYLREVMVGQRLTVHSRILGRSTKIVHLVGYILNRSTEEVSNVLETVSAHVDLETRKTTPLLPDAAAMLDSTLEKHRILDWDVSTSGVLGIRRHP